MLPKLSFLALASLDPLPYQGEREPVVPAETVERQAVLEAAQQKEEERESTLLHVFPDEISLADLFQTLARMRGVALDFDREKLSAKVAIRTGEGVSAESLWANANRLLLGGGMACVQASGEEGLSIVSLDQAVTSARLEEPDLARAKAGFVKVLLTLESADPEEIAPAIKRSYPKEGMTVEAVAKSERILFAGLRPQVEEAIALARILDEGPTVVIEEIPAVHVSVVHLSALLEQLVQKRKGVDAGSALLGSAIARPSSGTLLVVAPWSEIPVWHEMVSQLDREEGLETRWYVPRRFGLEETARLIEDLLGGSEGEDDLRVTRDSLSGSLVITATASAHAAVEGVFRRLEEADSPTRRVLRSFPVRHRDVEELLGMLSALVEAGAALPDAPAASATEPVAASAVSPAKEGATAPMKASAPRAIQNDEEAPLSLSADAGSSRILAYGEPRLLEQVENLLKTLDVPRPQVLVEALVVTLSDSDVRSLGVELRNSGTSGSTLVELASLFGLGAPPTGASGIPTPTGAGFSGVVLDPGSFSAVVHALETRTRGRTLTIPKVLVSNHEPATLDSVLHTPFLATNATTTVATTSLGGTEDAGTQIQVTPHIGEGDQLRLEYSVSISSFVGSPADPALPPPRQENKLEATASLPDGYAVVVGGLEVDSESKTSSRVPFLGSLPIVGWFFRDQSGSENKSRLFVFLRASILRSQSFEDLRWATKKPLAEAGVDDGWPKLRPRIMR